MASVGRGVYQALQSRNRSRYNSWYDDVKRWLGGSGDAASPKGQIGVWQQQGMNPRQIMEKLIGSMIAATGGIGRINPAYLDSLTGNAAAIADQFGMFNAAEGQNRPITDLAHFLGQWVGPGGTSASNVYGMNTQPQNDVLGWGGQNNDELLGSWQKIVNRATGAMGDEDAANLIDPAQMAAWHQRVFNQTVNPIYQGLGSAYLQNIYGTMDAETPFNQWFDLYTHLPSYLRPRPVASGRGYT